MWGYSGEISRCPQVPVAALWEVKDVFALNSESQLEVILLSPFKNI